MWLEILQLTGGLALILVGADILVAGASSVARRMGISELVVGLTIVAFGTSSPELVISLISAINGSGSLALGNVVGSNIFNLLMIVGCTAAIVPISVDRGALRRDIPFTLLSSLVVFFCGSDILLDGASTDIISRIDGLLMLCFFLVFLFYTFSTARDPAPPEELPGKPEMPVWKAVLMILGGLAGLVAGGDWFVDGASSVAAALGVSEAVIGLTIVAAGTSLPELATSVVAALKHKPGLAIGNAVGSCLFNVFFVLGLSAAIRPFPAGGVTTLDYGMLIGASALLLFFGYFIGNRKITRGEGIVMACIYVAYCSYLVATAKG